MDFDAASGYIVHRLQHELSPLLCYHCVEHTLDVLEASRRLSDSEKIDLHSRTLLETASLYHDAGMLIQYKDHESASVLIAREALPRFGYTTADIDQICELIMVTQLPQRPYNQLEQIICDADLDYLGRNDFFIHSFKLKLEWELYGVRIATLPEWFEIQINFLTHHIYFTNSAILLRNSVKLRHLEEIKQLSSKDAINS